MKIRVLIAVLLLVGSVGAQTDTLRPTTCSNVSGCTNTYDNDLSTLGGVYAAGIIDDVNPGDYQTTSGTMSGFSAPLHTYTAVVLKYKCNVSIYTGANGSSGFGSVIATWTGGSSGNLSCTNSQQSYTLPANVATASVTLTLSASGQNDASGAMPDPGSADTELYDAWIEGTYGVARKRFQVITTE